MPKSQALFSTFSSQANSTLSITPQREAMRNAWAASRAFTKSTCPDHLKVTLKMLSIFNIPKYNPFLPKSQWLGENKSVRITLFLWA